MSKNNTDKELSISTKAKLKASKEFLKELKTYFSSLSARGAKYLFLNIGTIPKSFVITNGDYEILTGYVPIMLSIHLVEFKDSEFYTIFLEFFNFVSNKPYILRISQVMKAFKENGAHELNVVYDQMGNMKIIVDSRILIDDTPSENEDEDEEVEQEIVDLEDNPFQDNTKFETITFKSIDICGQIVDNYHALAVLEDVVIDMYRKKEYLIQDKIPHYELSIPTDITTFHSNYYRMKLDHTAFKDENGNCVLIDKYRDTYTIIMDGLDVPSIKEFIKKRDNKELNLLLWCNEGGSIQHMAIYNDTTISVKTARPFSEIFPIQIQGKETRSINHG